MSQHEPKCLAPYTQERLLEVYGHFVRGDDECWIGSQTGTCFPTWQGNGRRLYVISAMAFLGHVPEPVAKNAKIVCHTCDNRDCWNPRHLYVGTPKTNARDAIERGQAKPGFSVVLSGDAWHKAAASWIAAKRVDTACFSCGATMNVTRQYAARVKQPACSDACRQRRRTSNNLTDMRLKKS